MARPFPSIASASRSVRATWVVVGDAFPVTRSISINCVNDVAEDRRLEEMTISCSYLIKIADNLIKRQYHKTQRQNGYIDSARDEAVRDLRNQQRAEPTTPDYDVDAALASLPSHEADAVRMVVCEGRSYEEVSLSLGVPVSTVNNWKYRGIKKLQAAAAEYKHSA